MINSGHYNDFKTRCYVSYKLRKYLLDHDCSDQQIQAKHYRHIEYINKNLCLKESQQSVGLVETERTTGKEIAENHEIES